ncbi:MAG: putative peptidoglycan lipid flippase [Chloroflexota bacterium]|nr:putative peptidoglycan lipid flippase [Chloroflexota bacterium]
MSKITKLSKAALLVSVSFGVNKVLGILRQLIIARQFGLSSDLDVFNVANNIPDMLYALISGGALAVAIIPVLTEVIAKENRDAAWKVFSQIANFAFLITAALSLLVAIFAWPLVQHPLGISPGFTLEQQTLVVRLMRLNLIGTLIFSMAGLLIAGLQANQHFLLPALGPILYNIGQIYGAVVLAPETGYSFGSVTLPAYGLGVDGLVYGVLIGSAMYFLILIPGLIKYQFKWVPQIHLRDTYVQKILVMLGPRVGGMLLYQLTFIARDNIASRLPLGSVSALTYGWMILQVPETLIGTAIGTALLPTLSEQYAKGEIEKFRQTIARIKQVLIALAVPSAILLAAVLGPFLDFAFGFDAESTQILLWVSRAFLAGLLSHVMLELGARVFFARQNAVYPFIGSAINLVVYILFGALLANPMGAPGIALADAAAFTAQSAFLFISFGVITLKETQTPLTPKNLWGITAGQPDTRATILRALLGSLVGGLVILLMLNTLTAYLPNLVVGLLAALVGMAAALFFVRKELKILISM